MSRVLKVFPLTLLSIVFLSVAAVFYLNVAQPQATQSGDHGLYRGVMKIVREKYVEPNRIISSNMLLGAVKFASTGLSDVYYSNLEDTETSFSLLIHAGEATMKIGLKKNNRDDGLVEALTRVEDFIAQNTTEPKKLNDITGLMINGLLSELDPHSNFFSKQIFEEFTNDSSGSFGGIGIFIDQEGTNLIVVSPIADTPAAKIGLKAKDVIRKIDKISTVGMSLQEAISLIKGEIGTAVTLSIMRDGWQEPRDFVIKRGQIHNSMDSHVFVENQKRIGYIRFRRFTKDSAQSLAETLSEMKTDRRDFAGLILDLRNNPGGFLDQAIAVSDLFLKQGVIVATGKSKKNIDNLYKVSGRGAFADFPMMVLINQNSASASEILAAALKTNKRAVIIGETTFGKGSVQSIFDLSNETALKLTVAQYFTADLNSIQGFGVSPDIGFTLLNPDTQQFRLLNKTEGFRENSLDNKFLWGTPSSPPAYTVRLLQETKDESDDQENDYTYVNGINITLINQDPAFKLASESLAKLTGLNDQDYNSVFRSALESAKKQSAKNMADFAEALRDNGIEWSSNASSVSTVNADRITLGITLSKSGESMNNDPSEPNPDVVTSSEKITFTASVNNQSDQDLANVIVLLQSTDRRIHNVELPLGVIPRGTSQSANIEIPPIKQSYDSIIPVKASIYLNSRNLGVSSDMSFRVQGDEAPIYTLRVASEHNPAEAVGTGSLNVALTNNSEQFSGSPVVTIRPSFLSGLSLSKNQFLPGQLLPGDSTSDSIHAELQTVRSSKADQSPEIKFQVFDADYNLTLFEQTIPYSDPFKIDFANRPVKFILNPVPLQTDQKEITVSGFFEDDKDVKDFFVFSGETKIYYEPYSEEAQPMTEFEFTLPLEETGLNDVRIFARDSEDVFSVRHLQIWSGAVRYVEQ